MALSRIPSTHKSTQTHLIIPNTGPNVPSASQEVKRKQIKTDSSYLFIERVSEWVWLKSLKHGTLLGLEMKVWLPPPCVADCERRSIRTASAPYLLKNNDELPICCFLQKTYWKLSCKASVRVDTEHRNKQIAKSNDHQNIL